MNSDPDPRVQTLKPRNTDPRYLSFTSSHNEFSYGFKAHNSRNTVNSPMDLKFPTEEIQ
jgi:hypothetical protein